MLEKGSYVPWSSRFIRYLDGKKEQGEMMKDSINNAPYEWKIIHDPVNEITLASSRKQEEKDLSGEDKKRFEAYIGLNLGESAILWERKNIVRDWCVNDFALKSSLFLLIKWKVLLGDLGYKCDKFSANIEVSTTIVDLSFGHSEMAEEYFQEGNNYSGIIGLCPDLQLSDLPSEHTLKETDIQEKDKNKAKNDKTEHENEKSVKKSQSQSQQSQPRQSQSKVKVKIHFKD
ncbi:hypothetical protein Tco_0543051 [Tanacetum coccineum]